MKKILLSFLILLLLVVGAISTVWVFPQIILTQDRVQSLVNRYLGSQFSQAPTNVDLKLSWFGIRGKRINLSVDRFCLKEPEGCFDKIHVELAFKWVGLTRFRIEELGPIEILNQSLTFHPSDKKDEAEAEKKPGKKWNDFVEIPSGLKMASLKILFPKVEIQSKDSSIKGELSVSGEDIKAIQILANAKSSDGLNAHVDAQTGFVGGNKTPFHAAINVHNGWGIDAKLDGDVQWDNMNIALTGDIKALRLAPWIHTLELRDLKITRDKSLHLTTNVFLKLEPKLSFAERDSAMPKASYMAEVNGNFDVEESVKKNQTSYDYTLKLGPDSKKGLHIDALLKGAFPFPKDEEYRFGLKDLFVEITIPEFQALVQSFKRTNSAIPAPFSALKGSIVLQAGKKGETISGDAIPLLLKTDLKSPEQTIQTSSEGKLEFKKGLKNIALSGKTDLSKIVFTLPEVDPIVPAPALKRDSRIKSLVEIEKIEKKNKEKTKKAEMRAEKGSSFDLDWTIDSKPGAIQIFYSICKPFVPVDLHLAFNDGGATGKISVNPLDLHYLNRDAHVDHFNYNLGKDVKTMYDGKLVIDKTDYTVFVEVFEKEGKPKVEFTSDPPLEENDIISVLLFNQTSEELSPDESNSVTNTQSAVANRALGLFSIWALSSTPIEAVSYNAASGVYAARVKLGAGLTATVGTNWENTQEVALRKRIGKNFVLSTIFGQEGESEDKSTKTLLEWFRRF